MSPDRQSNLVILIVEDNPADVVLFTEALEDAHTPADLHGVSNGEDALRFLRQKAPFAGAPRPDVIVLDLNLPVKSGREVLAELSAEPALNGTPVAILTTSQSEADVCDTYPIGRCRYFVKTGDFIALVEIVKTILGFALAAKE
jgi:two-component system, chemotaxis family, response regulator Rcp1